MILLLLTLVLPCFGQKVKLTHNMSEAEKAQMPAYLQSLSLMKALSSPPVGDIRNIAEFDPMEGVLIAYPLGIPTAVVREMAEDIMVYTIVSGASQESQARSDYGSAGVNLDNCTFIHANTDSYWTRDYGPWFVADENGTISIIDFTYNRPRPQDNQIPSTVAYFLEIESYLMDLVHCGGNYMTDGLEISISTNLVWEENSSKTHAQINQEVEDYLGIQTYHVVDDPLGEYIKHVDCWGKFLDVDKILIGQVPTSHSQYDEFEAIVTYFENQTSAYGNNYQVYRVYASQGQPYTNSLILNKKVLVPITGSADDATAISTYEQAMPGYEVIGFSGSWETTDALHCRTKGIADRNTVYIGHLPLLGQQPLQGEYDISANIVPYSGQPVVASSVKLQYRVNGGNFTEVPMSNTTGNTYAGTIPGQSQGSEIEYLILASDLAGYTNSHPYIGEADPHLFFMGQVLPDVPDARFIADNTDIIINQTVQFTDQSTNSPTSWLWTFEGGTPATSVEQNPSVTYDNAGTFTVTLQVSNAAGSDSKISEDYITVSEIPYCESQGNSTQYEWIADVSVGSLNNASGASGYTDFTAMTADLAAGDEINLSLTPGFASSAYNEYWKIWIDYNGDRDFEDTGEEVFSSSGNSTVAGSFTVPDLPTSINTRMRVSMRYNNSPGVCGSFDYGEVEDYSVTITIPIVPPTAEFSFNTDELTVDFFDQSTPGDNTIVSWQWNFGDGSTSSEQNPYHTYSANGTYNVTLEVTDAASQTSSVSKPVTVVIFVPDFDPPAPDPMTWATTPHATGPNSIAMTATTATDQSGVEYLFECTAGGGNSSSWQDSPVYEDTGLEPETEYTYQVKARDKSSNQNETDFSAAATATTPENLSTLGNTQVFSLSTTTASRRAMPYTMPEGGTIYSITMYHSAGSGKMILGLYAGEQLPENRLGITEETDVDGSTDWQTIDLSEPVFVEAGTTIWLAWVYETNPGIYYESGSPGRASSSQSWSGGMPDPFGSSSTTDYIYSIYATYAPGPAPLLPNADFTYTITDLNVDFIDQSTPGEGNIVDWQWNFGDGSTSTEQNPSHAYTEDGTYTVTLSVTNSENNTDLESKELVVGDPPVEYCTSQGSDVSDEWIGQVDIEDFSNSSEGQVYSDFTAMTIEMNAGQSYAVTLTPEFASSSYSEYWKIWIDLNHDGDFEDADELVFDPGSTSNTTVTGTINVPFVSYTGKTRMRVTMKYVSSSSSNPDNRVPPEPCETFAYGEVEDYTVHITN